MVVKFRAKSRKKAGQVRRVPVTVSGLGTTHITSNARGGLGCGDCRHCRLLPLPSSMLQPSQFGSSAGPGSGSTAGRCRDICAGWNASLRHAASAPLLRRGTGASNGCFTRSSPATRLLWLVAGGIGGAGKRLWPLAFCRLLRYSVRVCNILSESAIFCHVLVWSTYEVGKGPPLYRRSRSRPELEGSLSLPRV